MDRAVQQWLTQTNFPPEEYPTLAKRLNKSYTIYGCMLLLPPAALDDFTKPQYQSLYPLIAKKLKITHIAINKPIPLHHDSKEEEENILRSPKNFTPIYGDFGPSSTSSSQPATQSDFDSAFWVTAKQNSIYQIWSPRYTMFSRGNISEKARLLTLPTIGPGMTAVDLYSGIGYFAFSYLKKGVDKILCWDINEWSCEGLKRGVRENKFDEDEDEKRVEVFCESNEMTVGRIEKMKKDGLLLSPIRHVNLGMLPSSRQGLEIAVRILDREVGGWLHVHENFLVEEIEMRVEKVREEVEWMFRERGCGMRVGVDYVNRLKSYAPGVMHCVLDISVLPWDG